MKTEWSDFLFFEVSEVVCTRCTSILELCSDVNLQFMQSAKFKWEMPFSRSVFHE